MGTVRTTFAEEFERVLVESDTSVRRLARLSKVSRRTLENWLYGNTLRPRHTDQILRVARALQLHAVDTDRLLLAAEHPTLTRLRQNKQLQPDILLEWQLPPDTKKGQKHSALHHAEELLRRMPWNEEVHREVMEFLALNGRRSEALKQFEICKQALCDELGVEPSSETLALYERIRRSAHFSHDNIPATVTPLIGREAEMQSLTRLLDDPDVRLVTITGLGGIGKTRLAQELAWKQTEGKYKDGVIFTQLAPLETIDFLVATIAEALHLQLTTSDTGGVRRLLLDYLKTKQMLLVLDNCEHLLEEMTIVADILVAAPQVDILATSRVRLRLRAEHVYRLQGLNYNERIDHPASLLLKDTVKRIKPDFEITGHNAMAVNQLCRLVDGMPLALELAAGLLDRMPVAAVVIEIEGNLDSLVSDVRDMPARHRSLRAVIESTWNRLETKTRIKFVALSVFAGSFTGDAAEEVAGTDTQLLRQLVDHSLLAFDREEDRYQLHEMLRQFAAERLAGNPELNKNTARRHHNYYGQVAQNGGAAMHGENQMPWMRRLALEEDNIRQAFDWALKNNPDIEAAARFPLALHQFWHETGRSQEGIRQCEQLLIYREQLSPAKLPWLLAIYSDMIWPQGRAKESAGLRYEAMQLFEHQENREGMALSCLQLSSVAAYLESDSERYMELVKQGLEHIQTVSANSFYESYLLQGLGAGLVDAGQFDQAEMHLAEGYRKCMDRQDLISANYFLPPMISLAYQKGRESEALRLAEECLEASRRLGIIPTELMTLHHLGLMALDEGQLDLADQYLTDGVALAEEANYAYHRGSIAISLGEVKLLRGADRDALRYLQEAFLLFEEAGEEASVAECVELLAQWKWCHKKSDSVPIKWVACAVTYLAASGQIELRGERIRRENFRAELEAGIGKEEVARAWTEGEQMSLQQATEEVLMLLSQEDKFV